MLRNWLYRRIRRVQPSCPGNISSSMIVSRRFIKTDTTLLCAVHSGQTNGAPRECFPSRAGRRPAGLPPRRGRRGRRGRDAPNAHQLSGPRMARPDIPPDPNATRIDHDHPAPNGCAVFEPASRHDPSHTADQTRACFVPGDRWKFDLLDYLILPFRGPDPHADNSPSLVYADLRATFTDIFLS